MRKLALFALSMLAVASLVGNAGAAIKYVPGALVMTWPNGTAHTKANVIAAGAVVPTLPDQDFLPPGNGVGAFGTFVFSWDFEANPGATNRADAIAAYNRPTDPPGAPVAGTLYVNVNRRGNARGALGNTRDGGVGVSAIGDTAVQDSFMVRVVPINATSANLIVNGEMLIQRNAPSVGYGRFDIIVYPDSNTCNLDPTSSGAGAVFVGRLIGDRDGIEKADGGWSAGDFQLQVTADRVRIRAVGLTKVINCPNTANLTTQISAVADGAAVPASTPIAIGILSLLMAGAGWMVIRRRTTAA